MKNHRPIAFVATVALAAITLIPPTTVDASEPEQANPPGDHPAISVGFEPTWHSAFGISGGGSFHGGAYGGFLGGQLSLAKIKTDLWMGGFTDAHYDFGDGALTVAAGPEIGYNFFGIDAGAAGRFFAGSPQFGPQARVLMTVGLASVFGRYKYWPGTDEHVAQAGILVKLPLMAPWTYEPRR